MKFRWDMNHRVFSFTSKMLWKFMKHSTFQILPPPPLTPSRGLWVYSNLHTQPSSHSYYWIFCYPLQLNIMARYAFWILICRPCCQLLEFSTITELVIKWPSMLKLFLTWIRGDTMRKSLSVIPSCINSR